MAASTRSIHSRQRAAGGRSRRSMSSGSSLSRRRRRAAALIGRRAGRRAGPRARGRRQAPRGGRTGGGRRGRSSARDGRPRPARRNLGRGGDRPFSPPVWRAVSGRRREGVGAAGKVGGEVEGGGGGQARSPPAAAFGQAGSPGLGRPPPSDLRPGSKNFVAISGRGRGQRRRSARTLSNAQRARTSASAAGASGRAAKTTAAALAAAEIGSPALRSLYRLSASAVGVGDGQVERGRGGGKPAGVETGRAGGEVAPQLKQLCRRRRLGVADREAQVAQSAASALRRRILAEAAAL